MSIKVNAMDHSLLRNLAIIEISQAIMKLGEGWDSLEGRADYKILLFTHHERVLVWEHGGNRLILSSCT